MKISYKTHPILERLQRGNLGQFIIPGEVQNIKETSYFSDHYNVWSSLSSKYASDIIYITKPFREAARKASSKLLELYNDTIESRTVSLSFAGTIISDDDFTYTFENNYDHATDNWYATLYWFFSDKKQGILFLVGCARYSTKGFNIVRGMLSDCQWFFSLYNSGIKNIPRDEESVSREISFMMSTCIMIKMFKSYAEVETKFLPPKSTVSGFACKYTNDTKLPITWLDSKWFTNLVKSDAFKVRGHFRLQACGVGLKDHKIIWISDFMKTGYTAPARRLNKENANHA